MKYKILLCLLFLCFNSFAECLFVQRVDMTFSVGPISVNRDVPVGTILGIYESTTSPAQQAISCDTGNIYYQMVYNGAVPAGPEHVYATNVEGIGISLSQTALGISFDNPATQRVITDIAGVYPNHPQTLKIYKTGNIKSGVLNPGEIADSEGDDRKPAAVYNMPGGIVITQLSCSLTSNSLVLPLNDIPANDFGSTVGFSPPAIATQNLGLNCDPGANINVTLNGTQNPDVTDTSVLALSEQGQESTAQGVGVQILYNDKPLVLNELLVLKKSSGGLETFPISARYYQTKTQVMPGKANASATLAVTYQ
ncbi:fimbrial protein [Lelliottia sp.]|uniref:fimbrial protein n=1 Tax=Lelliottia sp. TaxID=1898429 RepID=UPI00388EA9C5